MKNTAGQSADLKMALKHDPCTPTLVVEAEAFPLEADEAVQEVKEGRDYCHPESWVANA